MAGYKQRETIDRIDSSSPRDHWKGVDETFPYHEIAQREEKKTKVMPIDTIASLQPAATPVAATEIAAKKVEAAPAAANASPGIMQKVWNFLWKPFSFSKETPESLPSNPAKPQGIGSPVLEAPFQMDIEAFQKLLNELREMIQKIKEINNEAEDEIQKKDFDQSLQMLIDYLKKQKKIREEVVINLKFDLVFINNQNKEVRSKLNLSENERIELNKNRKWWTTANTVTTIGTGVLMVATLGIFIGTTIATGGTAAAAGSIIAAGKATLYISQAILGVANGCTQLMQANLEKQYGIKRETSVNLKEKYSQLTVLIKSQADQMYDGYNKAQKICEWLSQVLKNHREASQNVMGTSRSE